MVVAGSHHRLRLHPQISIFNHRWRNVDDVFLLSMRFGLTRRDLSLKRSFIFGSRAQQCKSPFYMATKETSKVEEEDKKKKEEESLPPPPEKPEPGDCCGSGCVRCVWDVYYEELEDYNNKLSSTSVSTETKS